jgi:predicted TIM-barrel fold metal-dependent hydrolase
VELVRQAAEYGKPVQVHISTSNAGPQGPFPGGGTEQLEDLMDLADRVPEANYILAHLIGMDKDDPPVVDGYLDQIEKRFGRFPENLWAEIRDFNSPGVRTALQRIPADRLIAGTDWVTRVGPPFLPYGTIFGVRCAAENPYPPGVASMVGFLRQAGTSESQIAAIGFGNAARLLGIG